VAITNARIPQSGFKSAPLPQRTTRKSESYSPRPIPNWIASQLQRDHSARQLAAYPVGDQPPNPRELPS
jgi:hypothetical protein